MASGQGKGDSAYDFLYADLRRIGVLLSHLAGDGVPTQISRDNFNTEGRYRELDLKLGKIGNYEENTKGHSALYDPQWLIPLVLLDKLQGRLKASMHEAKLGDMVLMQGSALHIIDTAFLQTLYSKEPLRAIAERKALARATEAGKSTITRRSTYSWTCLLRPRHSSKFTSTLTLSTSGQRCALKD